MRNPLLLILSLALLLFSCAQSPVDRKLDAAEAIMEQNPDSALTILQAIDGSTLRGEPQARHALLLSQAYDKNYIDLTSDSLISIATDYYAPSDDNYHKMLAYFYSSVVYFNAKNFESVVRNALKAYDLALELNDWPNISSIESIIGLSFYAAHSFQTAYEWELKALEHAKIANRPDWLSGLYMRVGDDLHNLQRFQESLEYLDTAAALADVPDINILETQYLSHCFLNQMAEADSIKGRIIELGFQQPIRVILAQSQLHPKYALEALKNLNIHNATLSESFDMNFAYAMAYISNGDNDSAIQALKRHIICYNNIMASVYGNTLNNIQQQHNLTIANEQTRIAQSYRNLSFTSFSILILVTIIAVLLIVYLMNRQKTFRLQAERNLLILDKEYNTIKQRLNSSDVVISEKQTRINTLEKELFETKLFSQHDQETINNLNNQITELHQASYRSFIKQFAWIDKMCSLYLTANKTTKNKEKSLHTLFSKEINSIVANKSYINKLPGLIEQYDPSLLKKIDSLSLKDSEHEVLICIICGFSPAIIAFLLQKSTQTIYNLKSQIKDKLSALNTPASLEILEMITK